MRTVPVKAGKGYEVVIGRGLAEEAGARIAAVSQAKRVMLVSDDNVFSLYGERICGLLRNAGFETFSFVFPHGEESKNLSTYGELLEAMSEALLSRSDLVVALGGGVTGDMAGFAAATYQRGIGLVQIPTTLLACVDSSVGGKTAVDLKHGKNQAGAFCQPLLVLIDPDLLRTLPDAEYRNGMAEVIKTAVLDGEEMFEMIAGKPVIDQYEEVITRCVELKRDYVESDEFDTGVRMMLNLGHTMGHAVEACSRFSIPHGQAVAIGLSSIAQAAAEKGLLNPADAGRIRALLEQYALPTRLPYSAEALFQAAQTDKKNTAGSMRLIIPKKIGDCFVETIAREDFLSWLIAGGAAVTGHDEND